MVNKIRVLFVSYDGMTDSLGESQVIPYLAGLAKKDVDVHILSAEKDHNFNKRKDYIKELLTNNGIKWHHIFYTKKPPVLSTIKDIRKLKKEAERLHKQYKFDIIHCRSYIAAFTGLYLKKKYNVKFLFDMRGFYADERVDGNLWPLSNPVYRAVYKYFKKKEKDFLLSADYVISLTNAGKDIIHDFDGMQNIPVEVIPCCADLRLFDYNNVELYKQKEYIKKLGINEDDFIVSYLGSVGTWYMLDEMMAFFSILKQKKSNSKFLFITKDDPSQILNIAKKYNIANSDIIIEGSEREEVPYLLSLSDISLFFIKPVFSKKASSPTKLAELLGMGINVICNSNVGDLDEIVCSNNVGITINGFNEKEYKNAVEQVDSLMNTSKKDLRNVAEKLFSLDSGVEKYYNVYSKLVN